VLYTDGVKVVLAALVKAGAPLATGRVKVWETVPYELAAANWKV
jgi:hypothetical protein